MLKSVVTRFRAYQLGNEGASFSYFADGKFTLVEARITKTSYPSLMAELKACGKQTPDTLHITSWDQDHCDAGELGYILEHLCPTRIEYPGYLPHCDNAEEALNLILAYGEQKRRQGRVVKCQRIDPPYIASLSDAAEFGYNNILFHPKMISADCNNDNSTVKLFRGGSFNVLSLGDVESVAISANLRRYRAIQREVDIMILAHHGADNGFTNKKFLQAVTPCVAVCTSDYDNQFEHPKQEIRDLLYEHDIPIYTTKTGDLLVQSVGDHSSKYQVVNLIAGSTEVSSVRVGYSKKSRFLSQNADTIRNLYRRPNRGP